MTTLHKKKGTAEAVRFILPVFSATLRLCGAAYFGADEASAPP